MIERIYIDNFRCFSNFELTPERINLLLGVNGSGKSSLLDVFDRIVELVLDGRDVDEIFAETDLTRRDSREEQRFELDVRIEGQTFTYSATLERGSGGRGMALRDERVTCGDRILFATRTAPYTSTITMGVSGPASLSEAIGPSSPASRSAPRRRTSSPS